MSRVKNEKKAAAKGGINVDEALDLVNALGAHALAASLPEADRVKLAAQFQIFASALGHKPSQVVTNTLSSHSLENITSSTKLSSTVRDGGRCIFVEYGEQHLPGKEKMNKAAISKGIIFGQSHLPGAIFGQSDLPGVIFGQSDLPGTKKILK